MAGSVEVTWGGKKYSLRLTLGGLDDIQDLGGPMLSEIYNRCLAMDVRAYSWLFLAALRGTHPEVDRKEIVDLLSDEIERGEMVLDDLLSLAVKLLSGSGLIKLEKKKAKKTTRASGSRSKSASADAGKQH